MNFFKKITNSFSHFFSRIFLFFKKYFVDFFKDKILFKKIVYTLFIMAIFIAIGSITLPGIKIDESKFNDDSFLGILNLVGGGGLRQFSLVSLGISPFITSSLIMTILQTKIFPPIHNLGKSGPAGRIKLNYITYAITLFFGFLQAILIIQSLTVSINGQNNFITIIGDFNNTWYIWFVLPLMLVAGTFFSIFLSERITNFGVGNGTSMLILSGSLITIPQMFASGFKTFVEGKANEQLIQGIVFFILFIIAFIVMVFIVFFFYQAERKIPIQHTGAGRSKSISDLSYLPIKINPAGIMPVIFSSMVVTFPLMITQIVDGFSPSSSTNWVKTNLQLSAPIGLTIFSVLTFIFTIFIGLQQAKIDKIVEDFSRNSTFIPGIRPGEQTEDYLMSIVLRLSIFSAFYLTLLASSQYLAQSLGANSSVVFSGTTIMIIVTVSLETIQQIEARNKTQHMFKKGINIDLVKEKYIHAISKKQMIQEEEEEDEIGGSILW